MKKKSAEVKNPIFDSTPHNRREDYIKHVILNMPYKPFTVQDVLKIIKNNDTKLIRLKDYDDQVKSDTKIAYKVLNWAIEAEFFYIKDDKIYERFKEFFQELTEEIQKI